MPAMRLAPPFFAHACSFCTQCILHDCHCFCNWRVCEYLLSFLCSTPSRLSSWHPALPQDPGGNVLGRLISHVTGVLIYLPVRVTTICASCASFPWFINIIFSVTLDCMVSSLASSPCGVRTARSLTCPQLITLVNAPHNHLWAAINHHTRGI